MLCRPPIALLNMLTSYAKSLLQPACNPTKALLLDAVGTHTNLAGKSSQTWQRATPNLLNIMPEASHSAGHRMYYATSWQIAAC